jgi:hypothetical protein
MKPLKYFLLAGFVPVLVALVTGGGEPKYILPNLAFYAAPQMLWWLFCIIWWARWGPPGNRGLFFGGIVPADLLLLYMVLSGGESEKWFGYIQFAPVAVVLGGVADGVARRRSPKAQPAAPPNGGPAPPSGKSGVGQGPPDVV